MGFRVKRHAVVSLTQGKTRYPSYRRLGGPQGRSGGMRKISPSTVFRSPDRLAVASRYTDCAVPAPPVTYVLYFIEIK